MVYDIEDDEDSADQDNTRKEDNAQALPQKANPPD
jgi:hypothetical protein